MTIENHILDILQLYEYAMSIGKTLSWKENCDSFLKLILKRKNLNACWILSDKKDELTVQYSIPLGKKETIYKNAEIDNWLNQLSHHNIFEVEKVPDQISPIELENGQLIAFSLKSEGYLFFYSKIRQISSKDISQIHPVINKFSNQLMACRAYEDQKKLLNNLRDQNQELSDYAQMISHDLKSPLRNIDSLSAWIQEDFSDHLNDTGKTHVEMIRNSVEKMDNLISGILDYTTIGKKNIKFTPVNLNHLVREIIEYTKIPDYISIETSDLPIVMGDKYRLQQIFQNLIWNAVNYNDKPHGIIKISATEKVDHYQFKISDNGKGIDKAYHERIFKIFEKLEDDYKNTGIGLSIVKKIINLHKGKIWVESTIGEGTTFYFTIKKGV
jgi:signal transduction histidine kinase